MAHVTDQNGQGADNLRVIDPELFQSIATSALVQVPILPIKLVNIPRSSEDPRLSQANDDRSWPPFAKEPVWIGVDYSSSGDRAVEAEVTVEAGKITNIVIPGGRRAGRTAAQTLVGEAERRFRFKRQPLTEATYAAAREQLQKMFEEIGEDASTDVVSMANARLRLGAPVEQPKPSLPVNLAAKFTADLKRAIAFLKGRCILVTPNNRDAAVMTYRVSGKAQSMLGADVIALAVDRGMPADAEGAR